MEIEKIKETKHTCTYKAKSLICNAKFTISKNRFPTIHIYLERALNIPPTFHSIEELGDIFMNLNNSFEDKGIYTGMDMMTYIGCEINAD